MYVERLCTHPWSYRNQQWRRNTFGELSFAAVEAVLLSPIHSLAFWNATSFTSRYMICSTTLPCWICKSRTSPFSQISWCRWAAPQQKRARRMRHPRVFFTFMSGRICCSISLPSGVQNWSANKCRHTMQRYAEHCTESTMCQHLPLASSVAIR